MFVIESGSGSRIRIFTKLDPGLAKNFQIWILIHPKLIWICRPSAEYKIYLTLQCSLIRIKFYLRTYILIEP